MNKRKMSLYCLVGSLIFVTLFVDLFVAIPTVNYRYEEDHESLVWNGYLTFARSPDASLNQERKAIKSCLRVLKQYFEHEFDIDEWAWVESRPYQVDVLHVHDWIWKNYIEVNVEVWLHSKGIYYNEFAAGIAIFCNVGVILLSIVAVAISDVK